MEGELTYKPEPEREQPLEELTEERLIDIIDNERIDDFNRLYRVLNKFINIGDSASMIQSNLSHLISEKNHRSGEHDYDMAFSELANIEMTIKEHYPNGRILF